MGSSCPLSVVIPTYNEEDAIEPTVRGFHARAVAPRPGAEFIVVDDGATDRTPEILRRLEGKLEGLRVLRQANAGHGAALRRGLEAARGEWVFTTDSDGQFDPADFDRVWRLRGEADLVCGVRARRRDPLHRLLMSRLIRAELRRRFGCRLRDPNCPFKLLERGALGRLLPLLPPEAFAPSIILVLAAKLAGLRVREIPVRHLPRRAGRSTLDLRRLLRAGLRGFRDLDAFREAALELARGSAS